jgi:ABC-type multidrug transport system fused ATPase/permease subunit
MTIPKGSFVSITGESGCGKSTLASLIAGERVQDEGDLSIGETPLREATSQSLHQVVTVVSSRSYLFAGTVRETLLEGCKTATQEQMLQVLRRVNLLDFVNAQGGLDFRLSEGAGNLSGGQCQRLALARALLKNSAVYIFDEATSNIDAESENSTMEVIESLKGSGTVILISHRLANVLRSDEIVFLQQGKLVERGTHQSLMKQGGHYAALYLAQQDLEHAGREEVVCVEAG